MLQSIGRTVLIAVPLIVGGCYHEGSNEVVTGDQGSSTYELRIQPLLNASCGGDACHGGGSSGFASGLDLSTYDGIFRGSIYGTVVVPGSAYMSTFVQMINRWDTTVSPISSIAMPAGRSPLSVDDVQDIVSWIDSGALGPNDREPFPEPRPQGKVFFTSQSVDLVGVLDVESSRIMRYVTVGRDLPLTGPPHAPHNVQVDDQGRYYYVTNIADNSLKKYDALSHELVGVVQAGTSPAHVVITADGAKAYVTNFTTSAGRILVVNTATMEIISTISAPPLISSTHGARLSHDGRYLYVGSHSTSLIHVIRTDLDQVVAHIPVAPDVPSIGRPGYGPYQIAVRGDDRYVYVTLRDSGMVSVIERTGDTFALRNLIRVGRRPLQCEVTRDRRFLYVCNQGAGTVSVIDAQTNSILMTIPNVGPQPHGIDITEDSRFVYVTCENIGGAEPPHHATQGGGPPGYLAVIDVNSQSVIRKIEIGGFGAGVSVSPGLGN